MCGIVGIYGDKIEKARFIEMRDTLSHRGPDATGFYESATAPVMFGHRRLRIIDISENSDQPFVSDDGRFALTYNGEIYNYREIRKELESAGEHFSTDGDVEVVLRSFVKWGERCVERFEGMFAFAVWDNYERRLTLFRDRFGVKPLFWWNDGENFAFASEIKALLLHPKISPTINRYAIANFLELGYIPAPQSAFQGIRKLLPGHYLIVSDGVANVEIERWWNPSSKFQVRTRKSANEISWNEDELVKHLEELLVRAFERRMVADVPVGVFLSGGIDSSAVVALLAQSHSKLRTFTIGFPDLDYNEAPYARRVSEIFGTEHEEYICTPDDVRSALDFLPNHFDEPFGDQSAVPTYLVAKLARKSLKVALSAEGGDEFFGGYTRYNLAAQWLETPKLFRKIFAATPIMLLKKMLQKKGIAHSESKALRAKWLAKSDDIQNIYRAAVRYFSPQEINELMGFEPNLAQSRLMEVQEELAPFSAMRLADILLFLTDDILVKTDRATMATSLEGREPFLDSELFDFAAALPKKMLTRNGSGKYLLKKVMSKYIPRELIERPKKGFGMPLDKWLRSELFEMAGEILSPQRVDNAKIFSSRIAQKYLKRLKENSENQLRAHKVWLLIMLQLWAEKWL